MAVAKNRTTILVVLLLAIAGAGFWYWRTHRGGSGDNTEQAPPATRVGKVDPVAPETKKPRDGAIEGPTRVQIDDDPKGALRLEGQVVDAEDHGVGGATVVISSNPPRTATTEADGGFGFDNLVPRAYRVEARSKDGVAGPVTAKLTEKSEPVVLKLHPGVKLAVTVVGADGKMIEGATVELRGMSEQRELTKAGVATFANCVPGGYQLAAWSEGKAKAFQWIQLTTGDDTARIVLAAGAKVTGRVVDEKGVGVAGARVRYGGASDWSQQSNDRLDAATSDADGKFEFAALPAGTFRFSATHPERAPGSSPMVTLDGKTTRDGVTITLALGAVVKGRVVDTAKQPIASARVRIGVVTNKRAMIFDAPRQAYTDAKGEFEIRGLPKKALAAVALHESGASKNVDVDTTNGDARDVTLVIDVTGVISGVVIDPQGQPMENVQVSAGPDFASASASVDVDFSQWRLRGFPEELTDSAGRFKLSGLAPGTYLLTAAPAHSAARRGGGFGGPGGGGGGVSAKTGDTNVKITLPPEGKVKGKVVFADGGAPGAFTVSVAFTQEPGNSDGSFLIDALAPRQYEVTVRGASFMTKSVDVLVESGKTADVGTITVVQGRTIGGTVVADGQPVPNATVSIGRQIFGNGTSSNANFGPMGAGTKHDTTDANGKFQLSGFPDGDLTIVAEQDDVGRSRALRLPTVLPGQTELTLTLEKFGALSGVLRQGGKPAEGVFVSLQSTTNPGAIYGVASGADGAYRYDRLAPDTYKVSAMLGMPMIGMKFYAKQIDVPPGGNVTVDLAVEPGAIGVDIVALPKTGKLGAGVVWLATGTVTATTASELQLKLAANGPGAYQLMIIRSGEPAHFSEVAPGTYSACVVPYPAEVKGMAAIGYGERHSDSLMAYCKPFVINATPATQTTTVTVVLPPYVPDQQPGGGSGSGSGSGSATP